MKKYTDQQKLLAVQDYQKGLAGLRAIAEAHNVDVSSLRKWVADYRENGMAGIQDMSHKRRYFSPEFKLSVVQRIQEEELSCRQAAALFNLRKLDLVAEWVRQYEQGGMEALMDRRRKESTRKMTLDKLQTDPQPMPDDALSRDQVLAELNRLRAENAYLKKLDALVLANKQSATHRKHK